MQILSLPWEQNFFLNYLSTGNDKSMSYANLQEKSFMSHSEGNLEMIKFFKWKTIKRNKAIFLRRRKRHENHLKDH